MNIDDISALMHREEPLCDELRPHVVNGPLGKMIHHPLLISLTFEPQHCGLVNAQIAARIKGLAKAEADGDFVRAIFMHERPYRLDALLNYTTNNAFENSADYWPTVGSVWTDSENIYESLEDWEWLWEKNPEGRALTMSEEEREALAAFPDTLTVYRGINAQEGNPDGMSWTLDQDKAEWFAKRYHGVGVVIVGALAKSEVLAHFTGRNESEIVAFANSVQVSHRYEVRT